MTRLELLVAGVLLVCLLEVGMADILMSFGSKLGIVELCDYARA